jgi:hypothetical protein
LAVPRGQGKLANNCNIIPPRSTRFAVVAAKKIEKKESASRAP